jgi:hypothetical protein
MPGAGNGRPAPAAPQTSAEPSGRASAGRRRWQRLLPWAVTLACFAYLYLQIDRQAARSGQSALPFLLAVFTEVSWTHWLALMIPYSVLFFLIDSLVVWRVVNWFNARVSYRDILPIRASAYIISILNEQVGKGVMAVYLNRRDRVPGWEVGSSMVFIMFCEFYYLLFWATVGYAIAGDQLPSQFGLVPWIALGAAIFFVAWVAYFRGAIAPGPGVRDRPILKAFREAGPLRYVGVAALRSPALMAAVVVYTLALRLFGVEESFVDMLGVLPVIFFGAAVPTPMRAAAITIWVVLYPEREAQMAAFGLVQHNFFIFFNAAIGLLFLRRANRELFERPTPS